MSVYYPATCARCGIIRGGGWTQRTPICRDCHSVLSPAERKEWEKPEPTPVADEWAGHPETAVSESELLALIAQDYSGGKLAYR